MVRPVLVLVGLVVTAAISGATLAHAFAVDDATLNETWVTDTAGDSGGGPDLSSMIVTTYADGAVSLSVRLANRNLVQPHESVQIFVDLNDDGQSDVNLSLWPTGVPSYLARWAGSDWATVRQLPEAVQGDGAFVVRLSLGELRDIAGVLPGEVIGVRAGAWTLDPATGQLRTGADDWLPNATWVRHRVAKPVVVPPPPTTTSPAVTTPTVPRATPSILALACERHMLRATVTPAKGAKVAFVSFYANGKLSSKDTKAPYVAAIPTKGFHGPLTISAAIGQGTTQTLHKQGGPC